MLMRDNVAEESSAGCKALLVLQIKISALYYYILSLLLVLRLDLSDSYVRSISTCNLQEFYLEHDSGLHQ